VAGRTKGLVIHDVESRVKDLLHRPQVALSPSWVRDIDHTREAGSLEFAGAVIGFPGREAEGAWGVRQRKEPDIESVKIDRRTDLNRPSLGRTLLAEDRFVVTRSKGFGEGKAFGGKGDGEDLLAEGAEEVELSCRRVFKSVGGSK
jgi:hypothetical protein